MKTLTKKLLVLGGGPGGYVAAIRAGQLGIPTVLVEGESLGGTCLNVGCIPSKALIHLAQEYAQACRFTGANALGIRVDNPVLDLAQAQQWKGGIVGKLTGGVGALLRKNGVQVVQGWGTVVDGKTVDVATREGEPVRIRASTCCWPPARRRCRCRTCPWAGPSSRPPRRWR
jgi:dihydrolipoamide dehydrogenase